MKMSNPTTPTAADLLAEWKSGCKAIKDYESIRYRGDDYVGLTIGMDAEMYGRFKIEVDKIAVQLDKMCIHLGIDLVENHLAISGKMVKPWQTWKGYVVMIDIGTLIALLEWLLIKGK